MAKTDGATTIFIQKLKNIFINTIYRQPSGKKGNLENYFGKFVEKTIPIINKAMCVTNHNTTIIDHILTNSFDSKIDIGILEVHISDHFPIFFISKLINV